MADFDIIHRFHLYYKGGKSVSRFEIGVETASDLPSPDALADYTMARGTIGWDYSTGDFYTLKSDGKWYKQDGSGDMITPSA